MRKFLSISGLAIILFTVPLLSQEQTTEPRFSHKGFKASLGLGGFKNDFDEFGGELDEGGAASLSLGWGFSEHVSLWLAGFGGEHPKSPVSRNGAGFGGLELNLQYKFLTESSLQPYGKLGVGAYAIGKDGVIFTGGGLAAALGADYFFSPHIGLGLELQFKGIEYSHRTVKINGEDITTKLDSKLDAKSSAVLLTLTLQ